MPTRYALRLSGRWLLPWCVAGLAATGCRGPRPAATGFDLRELVAANRFVVGDWQTPGLSFLMPPRLGGVILDRELRQVVLGSPSGWRWRGTVPAAARLDLGAQTVQPGPLPLAAVVAEVRDLDHPGRRQTFRAVGSGSRDAIPWVDLSADLAGWAGRRVEISVAAAVSGEAAAGGGKAPAAQAAPARLAAYPPEVTVAWAPAAVHAPLVHPPLVAARPNVLFIVVDTLRRDRLTPYGYGRDTSPQIERWLASRGTVAEEAYCQAPWTVPSVMSFFTGRYVRDMLGGAPTVFKVPKGVAPLAERLAGLGLTTGGFIGNPIFDLTSGILGGFQTLYQTPPQAIMQVHADQLNRRALPWLAAHQDRPFFLYLHYTDPHDPYDNPDIVDNRSPFERNYGGDATGMWPELLNVGAMQLEHPASDLAHINALYDAEVRYVDRAIGQVLAALKPDVLANTLIVFTADHGEEIYDHHGWKHGYTLYEELIHVPLILRWDGRIPAGRRMAGTVRLLDLVPTLLDAAGAAPDPALSGMDLLPFLERGQPVPEAPAFAEGFSPMGPLRAAAVLNQTKLVLFDREAPYLPQNSEAATLYQRDRGRLARVEEYNLARDSGERHDLLPAAMPAPAPAAALGPGPAPGTVVHAVQGARSGGEGAAPGAAFGQLEAIIARRLDHGVTGVRLRVMRAPLGARVEVTARFAGRAAACVPYFLAADDRIDRCGGDVHFVLRGEAVNKGVRVEGLLGALRSVEVSVDGRPLPAARVLLGKGLVYRGGAVAARALLAPAYPGGAAAVSAASGCRLMIWTTAGGGGAAKRPAPTTSEEQDFRARLRALGYVR